MWLDFFTLGLATLRLYFLFAYDNGPWNIFVRLRWYVGIKPTQIEPGYITTNSFAYMVMCPVCSTVWYALILVIAYNLYPIYTMWVAWVLALSMFAAMLSTAQNRLLR